MSTLPSIRMQNNSLDVAALSQVNCSGCRAVAEIQKTASQNAKVELMLCDLSVLK